MKSLPIALGCLLTIAFGASLAASEAARLADAVERQDRGTIDRLLAENADVNSPQPDGMTAIHWAVHHDDVETTRALIERGADVKSANLYEVTPLAVACTNGNGEIVELLLRAGADPNTTLEGGESTLMIACRTGKIAAVRSLIAAGANVNAAENRGQTSLMWAAAEGHADVVQVLIDAGVDIRATLPSGFNALMFAIREGQSDVVRNLLRAGIDVNQVMRPKKSTPRGVSPGTSPLILAVENGHFELAIELVKAGADPDDQRTGFTALHTISWVRKPNRGDGEDGDPAPRGSGTLNSLDFVRQIVALGANVNVRLERGISGRGILSRRGATPLLLAAVTADVPLMRTLVELGADASIPNAEGATVLMAAAGVGTRAPGEEAGTEDEALEAVALAMQLGNDINAMDVNGETAMHGAAYKSFPRVVELLAQRGAKIDVWNRKNRYGWTPLLIAEGFRVGNFKPSAETIAAIHRAMIVQGVSPPPPTPRESVGEYAP